MPENENLTKASIEISGETMENLMGEFGCNPELAECHAKCCTNTLLLSDKEIARIRNYIGRNGIKPFNRNNIFSQEYHDVCPFLNPETLKCSIYQIRPSVCRFFECNLYKKKKESLPNYRKMSPINVLLTFFPGAYCPNPPDLKEIEKMFKEKKKRAYK